MIRSATSAVKPEPVMSTLPSCTFDEHIERWRAIFLKMSAANLKFKPQKCHLLQHPPAMSRVVEVEQKFLLGERTEELLLAAGGRLLAEWRFRDVYHDVVGHDVVDHDVDGSLALALADLWLRRRDSVWQLKYPVGGAVITTSSPAEDRLVQRYVETECEAEIVERVAAVLGVGAAVGSVDELVERAHLRPFAEFGTERRRYLLPARGVEEAEAVEGVEGVEGAEVVEGVEEVEGEGVERLGSVCVDLDVSDFGYAVGELEVVCREERSVPRAVLAVQAVASQLELVSGTNLLSKLAVFLRDHRPDLYRRLVDAHVLG
ncbi:thiamine-triphosphatase isoform X2 [Petromyzon marinus]|uniref:thiamine-triphosphatase isoform X2 n=1 Tax=Petromyzon marinus TaxID=7757 RepID=UPI003F6EDE78